MVKRDEKLQPPVRCDNCRSKNIEFKHKADLYGTTSGDWPYVWVCNDCKAMVGVHEATNQPLGLMASKETRYLRTVAHRAFDPIHEEGHYTRKQAYDWLARQLGISKWECHISWLTPEQLHKAIEVSKEYLKTASIEGTRRRIKRESREAERKKRATERFNKQRKAKKPKFSRYS